MKISLNNIGQIYDGKKVLSDISFDVNESEFITLIGPSGCGKSTIFKIITGLEKNYTGNVMIDGTDIEKYQGKLAYMPQNDLLLDWRTLYKNAVLPMEIEKTDKKIYYLLDNRIKDNIQQIKDTNKVLYLPASFIKRHLFYKENKNLFSTVLCFGNLPPNIRLKAKVYTYFHQLLFLKIAGDLSAKQKVLYWLKTKILRHWQMRFYNLLPLLIC